ncbi:thymidine kinase, partial [Chrysochromulina tobinii]
MGKLYFHYSTMNAGKSTMLLQAAYNYLERGMLVYLLTAKLDQRAGDAKIASRIGLSMDAQTFEAETNIYDQLSEAYSKDGDDKAPFACVFVDEAQFLSKEQVWQLARFVDEYNVPVMCYGLRVDFRGELFPGSSTLLALADELREATMVVRRAEDGTAAKE